MRILQYKCYPRCRKREYKFNVLSKTHKTWKTNGKREKLACASMGHLPKLKTSKMEVGENVEEEECGCLHARRPNFHGHLKFASIIYKIVIMSCRITKMPLLGLKCWPIRSDDVEMMWK